MLGSNQMPFWARMVNASCVAITPCSTEVQCARAARIIDSALCAWIIARRPCARASPQAASSCSCEKVGVPPSRMLRDAKILMRSAPSDFFFRTYSRSCSGVSLASSRSRSFLFRATGQTLKFPGYLAVYGAVVPEEPEAGAEKMEGDDEEKGDVSRQLPPLEEGQRLELVQLIPEQHFTQPPPRFTEAS